MSNWYVGQKVVCVRGNGLWENSTSGTKANGPIRGDKLVVSWHGPDPDGEPFYTLSFNTWPDLNYLADCFRPLDPLEEQIERIESEGCPEPELQEA